MKDATGGMADMLAFNGVDDGIGKVVVPPGVVVASGGLAVDASLSALFAVAMAVGFRMHCRGSPLNSTE